MTDIEVAKNKAIKKHKIINKIKKKPRPQNNKEILSEHKWKPES